MSGYEARQDDVEALDGMPMEKHVEPLGGRYDEGVGPTYHVVES